MHEANQNQSENCPVCKGDLKGNDAIAEAGKIIKQQRMQKAQMHVWGGEWSTAEVNDFPDSSFAWIEDGGKKDDGGKTTPRTLRHLPYKDASGKVDLPHVRNALARLNQTKGAPEATIRPMLEKLLPSNDDKKANDHVCNVLLHRGNDKTPVHIYPISEIKASEDGKLPKEIQVMPVGKWDTVPYGELVISASDLEEMKSNFDKGYRAGVPIDVDHDGGKAAGWIQSLRVADDGLWAQVEWSALGEELLNGKVYKFFSPEFNPEYTDPANKDLKLNNVLIAGSLVNRPLFKELKPIVASDHLTASKSGVMLFIDMNLADLKKKKAAGQTLTAQEEAYLKEKIKADDGDGDEKHDSDDSCAECKECGEKMHTPSAHEHAAKDDVKGKEKMITISAQEAVQLREDAKAGRLAAEKLEAKEISDTVESWMFSEKGGHFQPAIKNDLVSFYKGLNGAQRVAFEKIVEKMPAQQYLFNELGSAEVLTQGKAADSLTIAARELQEEAKKTNRTLRFGDAVKQALRTNPGLAEYDLVEVKGKVVSK